MPETLIAIDPGSTTGYAFFQKGVKTPTVVGVVSEHEFNAWLKSIEEPLVWVVEDYIIRPGTANQWNKGTTLKLIGRIENHLYRLGLDPPVMQQPSIKPMGYQHANMPYKKGMKNSHIQDAIAHGVFYRVKTGW